MVALTNTKALRRLLAEVDFPADRNAIVAVAENRGASREITSALRAMPPATYYEADEVMRAVPTREASR